MTPSEIEDIYDLSPMQEGMLLHALSNPEADRYIVQVSARVGAALNLDAFRESWETIVCRHAAYRTAVHWRETERPVQVVHRRAPLPLTIQDCRERRANEGERWFDAYLDADRRRGFDLTVPPLMRLALLQELDHVWRFVWTSHHLLHDGWSTALVFDELFDLYEARCAGRHAVLHESTSFRRYISWLQRQPVEQARAVWREYLEGLSAPTTLAPGGRTPARRVTAVAPLGTEELVLSPHIGHEAQRFMRDVHVTLSTLIVGIWSLLLCRYTGERRVVFGNVVSGRPANLSGVESIVGLFINTLIVHVSVPSDAHVRTWLQTLQLELSRLRQYDSLPLTTIRELAGIPAHLPLFESLVVVENYPIDRTGERRQRPPLTDIAVHEQTEYPLTFEVVPATALRLRITYDSQRFDAEMVRSLLGHAAHLIEQMVRNPAGRVSELSMVTEEERRHVVGLSEGAAGKSEAAVHERVAEAARRGPAAVAVRETAGAVSYAALLAEAGEMAARLRGPAGRVAVVSEGGAGMVVALLGALQAGHAFVLLEATHPAARLREILDDAAPQWVVVPEGTQARWQEQLGVGAWAWVEGRRERASETRVPVPVRVPGEAPAYLVYTSGSTGRPKGIVQSHRACAQFLTWFAETFGLGPGTRVAQWAPIGYDAGYVEMLATLGSGATLCLPPRGVRQDARALTAWLRGEQITVLQVIPSFLRALVTVWDEADGAGVPEALQWVLVAGEPLPVDVARAWCTRPGPRPQLVNLYGPTETVLATWYPVTAVPETATTVPVGRPLAGRTVWVVDAHDQVCPVGVPGEIRIGGPFLSEGYWGAPALTAAAYTPGPGGRVYRTGDRGRWRGDGTLEFLGRRDQQVKVRGVRVELAELEAVLSAHPRIAEQAVVADRDAATGEVRLTAYVGSATELDGTAVREWLRTRVPEAVVPATIVSLPALPRTATGKLDRAALAARARAPAAAEPARPGTPLEQLVAAIWQDVLRVPQVGLHDNFFDLGGHSLSATQIVNRLRTACRVELPLARVLEAPTVADLARVLEALCGATPQETTGHQS